MFFLFVCVFFFWTLFAFVRQDSSESRDKNMDQIPDPWSKDSSLCFTGFVLYQSGKPTAQPSHLEAGPLLGEMVQVYFTCRQPLGRCSTEIGKAPTTRTYIIIRKWMDGFPLFTFFELFNDCKLLPSSSVMRRISDTV